LIIFIASSLFIAFVIYLGFINGNPSISVEVSGHTDVQLGDSFTCSVMVTNTGDRDLSNVSFSDLHGFGWNGSLAVNESRTFFVEFVASTAGELVNEFSVDGYTEKGRHVWDQASWAVDITHRRYYLLAAVDEGLVNTEFRGTGSCAGDCIRLRITPKLEFTIDVEITSGLILINSGSGQNMIVAEERTVTVKPDVELDFRIEAYCLDSHKRNPSSKQTLSVQTDPGSYGEVVVELMKSLEDAPGAQKSICAIQIALWVITDDISKEDITINYSTEDIEDAKWLLENAGIDISHKRLFGGEEEGYDGAYFPLGDKSFADEVVDFRPGKDTVSPYDNPQRAIGPPDKNSVALGHGGVLTIEFTDTYLIDVDGADLYVFESGPSVEPFKVEISEDGSSWIDLGTSRAGQPASFDIHSKVAPGDEFHYVRITDANSYMSSYPYAGVDIDAVGAIGVEEG